jgi:hypothetical protein
VTSPIGVRASAKITLDSNQCHCPGKDKGGVEDIAAIMA